MRGTLTRPIVGALALQVVVTLPLTAIQAAAADNEYAPPELLSGVRVGDGTESVLAQQGWYRCGGRRPEVDLCFDRVKVLGETGRYTVSFVNGKALTGELVVSGLSAMIRMIDRLPEWGHGEKTIVSIQTKNSNIDIIKAVHDLGGSEAMSRFSRYLRGDSRHLLTRLTFVPQSPPPEQKFTGEDEFLDSLSADKVFLSLWVLASPLDITVLTIIPSLEARKKMFPEFCDAKCEHWVVPEASDKKTWWDRFVGFFN